MCSRGDVERVAIATNAHLSAFKRGGPPVPDDGLFIEIVTRNTFLRPLETLPPIEDAELAVRVTGRYASVGMNKGMIALPSGRKLSVANGLFEVPDCEAPEPPTKTRMRIEGAVPVAGELLETERLREFAGMPFDISSAKGNVFAQVSLAFPLKADLPPGSSIYSVTADISNFSVDNMLMGQKVEAQSLRINAGNQGYQIRGDTKIAGAAATLDYRKAKTDEDAEVRIQTTLDEAGRSRLGFDVGHAISGSGAGEGDRLYGPARPGQPFHHRGRSRQRAHRQPASGLDQAQRETRPRQFRPGDERPGKAARVENMAVEGSGAQVKGGFELDASGDILTANFPVFSLADGDKASFKADRASDGTLARDHARRRA